MWSRSLPTSLVKCKVECRAFSNLCFSPYTSAMPTDDTLDRCQSNTRPFELCRGMKSLKGAEQFVYIGHVKTGSIVTYKIC
jgi:hypothetical protein